MTSFVNMFQPARYTCYDIKAEGFFVFRLGSVLLAAGWSSSSIRASHRCT